MSEHDDDHDDEAPDSDDSPPTPAPAPATPESRRLDAIDVLRGIVMVLMSIDHASEAFNGGRLFTDSFFFYNAGTPLPAGQFFTRWITHLCAPTFVALAGTSLAISTESRRARGESERAIDQHILARGFLILVFELVWMSFAMVGPGRFLLQVLFAIGSSLIAMAALRRLGDRTMLILALVIAFFSEVLLGFVATMSLLEEPTLAMLVAGGRFYDNHLIVAYPMIPWLSMMMLGWAFGRRLVKWRAEGKDEARLASRTLAIAGVIGLVVFALLRAKNTYGNMLLTREDQSLIQWLHVSKYPPSATYIGLELGIASLLLALLFRVLAGVRTLPRVLEPLRVLGSTALFYYLLHLHLLTLVSKVTGLHEKLGIASAYYGALGVLVILYPLCAWYRRFKATHKTSFARFV